MPERSRSDEFVSRLRSGGGGSTKSADSFTRTSATFTSSTMRGCDPSGSVGGRASPSSTGRRHGGPQPPLQHPVGGASASGGGVGMGSAAHRPTSFSLHGLGDFDTLETRLQKALDSPTLLVSNFHTSES